MDKKLVLAIQFAAIDKLSGSMKSIVGLGKTGGMALRDMKREATALQRELADVNRQMLSGSGNVYALAGRQAMLAQQLAKTNAEIGKQKKHLADIASIDATNAKMQARAGALKAAGQENVIGGASMLAPLILATKQAGDFQDGMIDIGYKANLTGKEINTMTRQIMAAADAAKQLPEAMRQGVDVLAGFGMDPRQAAQMMAPIGKASTAYKAEIADMAAASFANFQNLKVPVKDTARAIEIMAAAGKAGAFEMKDMAQYFPMLTASAQALKQTGPAAVADLAAAAQVARTATGDAASAATNLQNLLSKINSKVTVEKFKKEFGVDLPAALKKAYSEGKTPMEAIAEITNRTLGGDLTKLSYLFEAEQVQGALRPLIQNMDLYRKIRADALASTGAVEDDFARRSAGANTNARALYGNVQKLAILAGSSLLPALVSVTGGLNSMGTGLANFIEAHPDFSRAVLTGIAGLAAFRIGLGALQFAFGGIIGPLGNAISLARKFSAWGGIARIVGGVAGAFRTYGPVITGVLGKLGTGALAFGRTFLRMGAMMLTNPFVLLAVGIGAAAYLIYANWEKIKAGLGQAKAWLGGLASQFWAMGKAIIQGLANGISAAPGAVWNALRGVVMGGITNVKAMLGIRSPSRLFMGIGGHVTEGLAIGVDRGARQPLQSMNRLATGLTGAMALGAAPAMAAGGSAGAQARMQSAAPMTLNITINTQAGQDAQAIADAVIAKIKAADAVARRSSYQDN